MATITNRVLTIDHDNRKKLANVKVTCNVNFTGTEICLMKACPGQRMFKLKCELWADDPEWLGGDEKVWTFSDVYYFPDPSPTPTEARQFLVTLGEGVLDEDWWGEDEIYGKLILQNLFTMTTVAKKTNTVHHSF